MQLRKRTVSGLAILAMTASLAAAPGVLRTASATPAGAGGARSSVTAECANAHAVLASARARKVKAKKAVVKAKKSLRSAKKADRPVKVRKARKVLKKAKVRRSLRTRAVRNANARVAYACAAPTSTARANGAGMKIGILGLGTGTVTQVIDLVQLNALLDRLLPGVAGLLDPAQQTALLGGFNAGDFSLEDATLLLGSTFSPEQLQSMLAGTASPELVLALAQDIVGQLSGLTGGVVPVPGSFDPTALLETFAGMFGSLDPTQIGSLLALLTTAVGSGGATFDAVELTSLLDALVPGVSGLLDPAQLTSLLDGLNGGGLDASTLSNLLGGQFSAAELSEVLAGTASASLVGEVLAHIVAQLGTLGGGDLVLPGTLDPVVLQDLVDTVTGIVTDLLGGVLGPVGGVICTLLPLLC